MPVRGGLVRSGDPPRFALSRGLFLRLLGGVYFVAFASLAPQLPGLIGSDGLLPAADYLERAYDLWGAEAYARLPTLLWVRPGDALLTGLCWLGIALSAAALAGIAPIAVFAALWGLYLSLAVAGQDFLLFQWDLLLLETGVLAVLYAPRGWWPPLETRRPPSAAARWLVWSLAFKLTFLSGVTKLLSGDETWRSLTALRYHYETQPLPTWLGWYAHNAPDWFGAASVGVMFFVELAVPFVVFVPPRFRAARTAGCALLCLLQALIAATGNYGFFNLLAVALYVSLLDDAVIGRVLRRPRATPGTAQPATPRPRARRAAMAALVMIVAVPSALTFVREIRRPAPMPGWSEALLGAVAPLRSVNGYGLFRVMTTERPEIVVEGSADGVTWIEYPFPWKAGDRARAPAFVQPHMPRLDWQMWFAALDPQRHAHWLFALVDGLLENDPAALGLLDGNPFPGEPPRFIRLALYRYRFTTPGEGSGGDWWARELTGYLTGPVSARRRPGTSGGRRFRPAPAAQRAPPTRNFWRPAISASARRA